MREAEVWRTLKPFQPSLIEAERLDQRQRRAKPARGKRAGADDHRRPLRSGEGVRHRLRQLAEQLQVVAKPLDLHPEVDFGPDREDLAALARDLADARGDQRRFPADVRADEQHRRRHSRCPRWSN